MAMGEGGAGKALHPGIPPQTPDPLGLVGCLDDLRPVNPCYGGNPGYPGNGSQWRRRAPPDAHYYVTKQAASPR